MNEPPLFVLPFMAIGLRRSMAKFRDGIHISAHDLRVLEKRGLVVRLMDGSFEARPGTIEAFNARFGTPPSGNWYTARQPGVTYPPIL